MHRLYYEPDTTSNALHGLSHVMSFGIYILQIMKPYRESDLLKVTLVRIRSGIQTLTVQLQRLRACLDPML